MARFRLNPDYSLKKLGADIFNLGAEHSRVSKGAIPSIRASLDSAQDLLVQNAFDFSGDITISQAQPEVRFHYDGLDPESGKHVLHVVVPDMDGIAVGQSGDPDPNAHLIDFAAECMGGMVIRGCGQ